MAGRLIRINSLRQCRLFSFLARALVLLLLLNVSWKSGAVPLRAEMRSAPGCLDVHNEHPYLDPNLLCRVDLNGQDIAALNGSISTITSTDGMKDTGCDSIAATLGDAYWGDKIGEWTGFGPFAGAFTDLTSQMIFAWTEKMSDYRALFHEGTHLMRNDQDEPEAQYYEVYCAGFIIY